MFIIRDAVKRRHALVWAVKLSVAYAIAYLLACLYVFTQGIRGTHAALVLSTVTIMFVIPVWTILIAVRRGNRANRKP